MQWQGCLHFPWCMFGCSFHWMLYWSGLGSAFAHTLSSMLSPRTWYFSKRTLENLRWGSYNAASLETMSLNSFPGSQRPRVNLEETAAMAVQESPTCFQGELSTLGYSFAFDLKVEEEILMKGEDERHHCYLDPNLLYFQQEILLRFNLHIDKASPS